MQLIIITIMFIFYSVTLCNVIVGAESNFIFVGGGGGGGNIELTFYHLVLIFWGCGATFSSDVSICG